MLKSRTWSLVAITFAAFGAVASTAQAQVPPTLAPVQGDVAACVFAGSAAVNPEVDVLSNEGGYTFTNVAGVCALTDLTDLNETQVGQVVITSSGEYENLVCGTGTADSETWEGNEDEALWTAGNPDEHAQEPSVPAAINYAPGSPIVGPGGELPANINYHIDFVAGVGVLRVSDWADDDGATAGAMSGHADGKGANGEGVVVLGPPVPPGLGNDTDDPDCTTGFTVVGAAVVNLHEKIGV